MAYGSGNPEYDRYAQFRFRAQTERGPGTEHRRLHPSMSDLTEDESKALRLIYARYDRRYNVVKETLPEPVAKQVDGLESLGFIRVEQDGRIVPSFVFQEHGKPIFKKEPIRLMRGNNPRPELERGIGFLPTTRAPRRLTA